MAMKPITVNLDNLTVGDLEDLEAVMAKQDRTLKEMLSIIPRLVEGWTYDDVRALKITELNAVMEGLESSLRDAVNP